MKTVTNIVIMTSPRGGGAWFITLECGQYESDLDTAFSAVEVDGVSPGRGARKMPPFDVEYLDSSIVRTSQST